MKSVTFNPNPMPLPIPTTGPTTTNVAILLPLTEEALTALTLVPARY